MRTDLAYNKASAWPNEMLTWFGNTGKRFFDILASLLGLLLLSPLFVLIALLLKREGPGPIFFRGSRVGRNGKVFGILKFRTMYERPESYAGPRVTAHNDERITPLGKWLRDTKINELPQLWNVLVGEMSLVGPRPEDPEIVSRWPEDARKEILSVRPGITSPASIAYHDEEKLLSQDNLMGDYLEKIAPDKLRLDRLYVRHHTFFTDLDAIFWTLIVLVPRMSIQPKNEGSLFGGPFTRWVRAYLSWTVIDFFISLIGAGITGLAWRSIRPLEIGWGWASGVALAIALLFGFFNTLLGLKRVEWSRAAPDDVFGIFVSCGLVAAFGIMLDAFIPAVSIPDGFLITASVVISTGFVVARYRLRLLTGFATRWVRLRATGYGIGERVLIVGAGSGGEFAVWLLGRPDFARLFNVLGYVDDDPGKQGMRYDGYTVLGSTADIPAMVELHDVGIIFYAIARISSQDRERILQTCRHTTARLIILSDVLSSLEQHLTNGKAIENG